MTSHISHNKRRWPRRLARAIPLALLAMLIPAVALATHTATVQNTPGSADQGVLTSFTLSVTNDATSKDAINKVQLAVDTTWTLGTISDPASWSHTIAGNTITWSTTSVPAMIANGATLTFSWNATPGATGNHSWTTTDKKSGTATGTLVTTIIAADFKPLIAVALAGLVYAFIWWRMRRKGLAKV